tara:strand:- start:231 stop:434 length:204 start_codon:yes stop_codon:yes gene_type:complete
LLIIKGILKKNQKRFSMWWISEISLGDVIVTFLACCLLHELLVLCLPDRIAGPGGWLINTDDRSRRN